ncbi:spore germination protein [Paenibacillus sp. IB182496]|uniref:Spore germination protein n=2 Tax=Paenibacillus sabuli TaxID=2772509 RepID=A0A927BVH0_9BACL|nr:spore germination protein [Paenibacillus sabuli]
MTEAFSNSADLIVQRWRFGALPGQEVLAVYLDTLVDSKLIARLQEQEAFQHLLLHRIAEYEDRDEVERAPSRPMPDEAPLWQAGTIVGTIRASVGAVLDGKTVIFLQHQTRAFTFDTMDVEQRHTSEPITEPSVQGPQRSMIEDLERNIGMLRNLLKSPRLRFDYRIAGKESRRKIAFGYLEGAVQPDILEAFLCRVKGIEQEEIVDTSYLEACVGGDRTTPFPQVRYTERPDTAVLALLDGKIIALVHGSPTVLICPVHFLEFFTSSEDYYCRPVFSSLIRMLRMAGFLIAFMLPSSYIALSAFHSELVPTVLLLAILKSREGIPFPALLEALIMEFFFELLREAGLRLPRPVGSAVSIVGALVIGQAAIQSQIASPVMVIVVALTGIASFAFPQYNMAIAVRLLRFPLMLLAATFGGLGIMTGLLLVYLHLSSLRSLGQPYLSPLAPLQSGRLRRMFLSIAGPRQAKASSAPKGGRGGR